MNYLIAIILGTLHSGGWNTSWHPYSGFAIMSGILLVATFFVYSLSVLKAGMAVTAVSGKMSVIIPVCAGLIFWGENAGFVKLGGILLALAAFILTLYRKNDPLRVRGALFLPLLLFLGNGMNDVIFKWSGQLYLDSGNHISFLTQAFGVSFAAGCAVLMVSSLAGRQRWDLKSAGAGILLGILNWYSTWFFLAGVDASEVSVFVPVFNASLIVLVAMAGIFFFREKMSWLNLSGLLLAVAAIVAMVL